MAEASGEARKSAANAISARLVEARWAVGAAAFVLLSCAVAGRLAWYEALLAFVVIALAAVVAPRRAAERALPPEPAGAITPELLAVLSGLPDPVIVLDRRGTVAAFNERAHAALGDIRTGEPVSFALRAPEVLKAVRAATAADKPQIVFYTERVPVERWREAHVAAARVGTDGPLAIVVALRDLTEQRRSERMRGDFVANASHELRTPLASLLGFIETLQGPARNDPGAREKFLEIMRAQANRMSRLIDDLLSLSRIELKAHVRPETIVDLGALVRGVVDSLGPLAAERKVEIKVEADDATTVRGDRDELIRVAENLIGNAIKYGQSGGRVDVSIVGVTADAETRLVVRDYGPGVAQEHLPRLTERFYRVDVDDSRDKGGTGLGLALVKHILQRHGGRLTIESVAGEGATFTAILGSEPVTDAALPTLRRAG